MLKVITYHNIEDKNAIEKEFETSSSSHDSLVHCLNVMDFLRAFRQKDVAREEDGIDWIVINLRPAHE